LDWPRAGSGWLSPSMSWPVSVKPFLSFFLLARAGIQAPTYGAHQFRHALATEMLHHGASLAEIGGGAKASEPDLYQGRSRFATRSGLAVAGRCAMTSLRGAVREYLNMRRQVGARLGAATLNRATGGVGAPPESRAHLRAPSECDRSTHADSPGGFVVLPP
jgi:hypothetical protein